jgi:hypothetical protein
MRPRHQVKQDVAQAEAHLVGKVLESPASRGQMVKGLFGQKRLGPVRQGGQPEAALEEGQMQIIIGQPLQLALPQELASCLLEVDNLGPGKRQNLGKMPCPWRGHRPQGPGHSG